MRRMSVEQESRSARRGSIRGYHVPDRAIRVTGDQDRSFLCAALSIAVVNKWGLPTESRDAKSRLPI